MVKGHLESAVSVGSTITLDDLEDYEGNTILHLLAADGNTTLIRRFEWKIPPPGHGSPLLGWNFNWRVFRSGKLNQVNRTGRTAWMLAAEKGHLDIVKHLLPNPPRDDLQLKDKSGKTGLDLALANNHKEVVAYLTKLQQDLTTKGAAKDKK
jgi:ankyrin repeat protein